MEMISNPVFHNRVTPKSLTFWGHSIFYVIEFIFSNSVKFIFTDLFVIDLVKKISFSRVYTRDS